MNTFEFSASTKTLRQRLNEGRIPVPDGLQYAALLAEALRVIHDEGRAHGGVTPDAIILTASGLNLLPAIPGNTRVTPYTAPEVAGEQKPADARSDIFSFGAVVFEMLTGRKAFEGESEGALVASLCGAPAPPSGSAPLDRLLAGCFPKEPPFGAVRTAAIHIAVKRMQRNCTMLPFPRFDLYTPSSTCFQASNCSALQRYSQSLSGTLSSARRASSYCCSPAPF